MPYNLTNATDVNGTLEFVQTVNEQLMGGWYGPMILIVAFVILFMAFTNATRMPVKSFVGASFLTALFSMLLFTVNLVPPIAVFAPLILSAIGVAFWKLD